MAELKNENYVDFILDICYNCTVIQILINIK